MSIATDITQTLIDPAEFAGRIFIDGEVGRRRWR